MGLPASRSGQGVYVAYRGLGRWWLGDGARGGEECLSARWRCEPAQGQRPARATGALDLRGGAGRLIRRCARLRRPWGQVAQASAEEWAKRPAATSSNQRPHEHHRGTLAASVQRRYGGLLDVHKTDELKRNHLSRMTSHDFGRYRRTNSAIASAAISWPRSFQCESWGKSKLLCRACQSAAKRGCRSMKAIPFLAAASPQGVERKGAAGIERPGIGAGIDRLAIAVHHQ